MPRNAVLNGRYLTGKVLKAASNEFNLAYRALDTRSNTPMVVREYFPRELARRLEGTPIAGPSSMKEAPSYSFGLKSFIGEARELRSLFDPHVITIRHIFEENGTAYVVEDYCEAQSLASLLEGPLGRLAESDALALIMPLLDTLETAHHKQLPHLDLRPENILVKNTTEPVLTGFAGARIGLAERTLSLPNLHGSGCTPIERYLSTREMGPWTDVYSIAAILYRLLTGLNVPEAAERSEADTLIPIAQCNPEGSTRIAAAIMLALRINRKDRPQSIGEFHRALLPEAEILDALDHDRMARPAWIMAGRSVVSQIAKMGFALGGIAYLTILLYVGLTSLVNTHKKPGDRPITPAAPRPSASAPALLAEGRKNPLSKTVDSRTPSATQVAASDDAHIGTLPAEEFRILLDRAENGTADDWLRLAKSYEEGNGTPKSIKKAIKWYGKAAEQNLPEAQAALARLYITGQDHQHSRSEGVRLFQKAAEQGFADAQFALGTLHELGLLVSPNLTEAIRWYRAAAENGHPVAQNRLGKLYDDGQGVPEDDRQAAVWYRRAAEQGINEAQYNLAIMYEHGEGVEKNRGEAMHWLELSAAGNNSAAKQLLKKWQMEQMRSDR